MDKQNAALYDGLRWLQAIDTFIRHKVGVCHSVLPILKLLKRTAMFVLFIY